MPVPGQGGDAAGRRWRSRSTSTASSRRSTARLGLGSPDLGRPLRDLEISYRPLELRSLIDQAQSTRRPVRVSAVVLGTGLAFIDNSALTRLQREVKRNREELETTNEELQSSIEELETTNEEMRIRSGELEETRTFLEGVLSSVAAGVVVLDADLRARGLEPGCGGIAGR